MIYYERIKQDLKQKNLLFFKNNNQYIAHVLILTLYIKIYFEKENQRMKKIITLAIVLIFAVSAVMPVMAAEEEEQRERTVFKTDTFTSREGDYLSVYDGNIRENKNGELSECNCMGICYCTQLYHVLEDTTDKDFYSAFLKSKYDDHGVYCDDSAPFAYVGCIVDYDDDYAIYSDCSTSMTETFCYEKSQIMRNLSSFLKEKEIEDVFKNQKTDLYGLLKSFDSEVMEDVGHSYTYIMPEKMPIIITDLWDVKEESMENYKFVGQIIFCVPYASTNKEAVLHCEEFVNDILWNLSPFTTSTSINIVYTDEVIARYSNGYYNDMEGCIKIYVP